MSTENLRLPDYLFVDEDGDIPESDNHSSLIHYLQSILEWLYRLEGWYFHFNMSILQAGFAPVAPDVALYKGIVLSRAERDALRSWSLGQPGRPAPSVVFEICSEYIWPNDVNPNEKPFRYQQMGVKEYFVYDPNTPRLWNEPNRRLRGWRYEGPSGFENLAAQELQPNTQGYLESRELDSWLVEDGPFLRLLDRQGQTRLTSKEVAQQSQQSEAELRARLRAKGIDPDSL